jgi:hypothetical protein
MGLVAPVLIGVVLFFWLAFMFTLYTMPSAIVCLCNNQYIRASLWISAGIAMLFWWSGAPNWWEASQVVCIPIVSMGAIASAYRYSKFRQTAVPTWTPPPPPDATNVDRIRRF